MRAIVQRCRAASVQVAGEIVGKIEVGLVVFLGIMEGDEDSHAKRLSEKIAFLRIFSDVDGKFNQSVLEASGSVLLISNFTVCGETAKGNRPSFKEAAPAARASELYKRFAKLLEAHGLIVQTGIFAADMQVHVENDGPVTLILEVK